MLYGSLPYFVWFVSEEGLGFKAFGIGRGIVPAEAITEVTKRWSLFGADYRIRHNSPEVRNPIEVPEFVARDLESVLENKRRDRRD